MEPKQMPIEGLKVSFRVKRALISHGIKTVGDLLGMNKFYMVAQMRWLSYGAVVEIDAALKALDLVFPDGQYWSPEMANELERVRKKMEKKRATAAFLLP